jgi:hypothetical protein
MDFYLKESKCMTKRFVLGLIVMMMAIMVTRHATVKAASEDIGPMSKVPFMTQVAAQLGDPCYNEKQQSIHGHNNCGPASVAMAIVSLNKDAYVSVEMAAEAMRGAGLSCNQGYTDPFNSASLNRFLNERGLMRKPITTLDDIKTTLSDGYAVVVLINNAELIKNGIYGTLNDTAANHIIVVTGYNDSGFFINDPLRNSKFVFGTLGNYPVSNELFAKITANTFNAMAIVEMPATTLSTGKQNPYYFLLNASTSDDVARRKGLDATDWGSGYIGTSVQTWDVANVGGANQAWYLEDAGDNSYYIKPYHSDGMCLDVQDESRDNGARVQIFWCTKRDNQRFTFAYVGKHPASLKAGLVDAYRIVAKYSGKVIDVRDNRVQNGAVVHQWTKTDDVSTQIWRLQPEDATKLRPDSECQRNKITSILWPKACAAEVQPTPTPVVVPTITFPGNGHVFRDAWSFTWNNASTSNLFKICRDGNSNECVVSEQRSGGSYQSNSASWAKQQTGKWCATVGVTSTGPWSTAVCFTMSAPRITSPTANQQVRGFWQINWVGDGTIFQMCTDNSFRNCLVNQPVSGGVYRAQNEAWARIQRGNYCARVGVTSIGPWSDTVCFNVDNTISVGGGLYRISSAGTNISLDVKDRKDKNGTIIQIYEFTGNGGSNQKWRFESRGDGFYAIRTAMSSKRCLDVKGNSSGNSAQLQIYDCHWGNNQQFRVVDMGSSRVVIVARNSNRVLDVKGARIKNGTIVQQYDVHGQGNQLWDIAPVR